MRACARKSISLESGAGVSAHQYALSESLIIVGIGWTKVWTVDPNWLPELDTQHGAKHSPSEGFSGSLRGPKCQIDHYFPKMSLMTLVQIFDGQKSESGKSAAHAFAHDFALSEYLIRFRIGR